MNAIEKRRKKTAERLSQVIEIMDPVDRITITNGLRLAADRYEEYAVAAQGKLAKTRFTDTCLDCRAVADALEL